VREILDEASSAALEPNLDVDSIRKALEMMLPENEHLQRFFSVHSFTLI
jgi:hypothetical protein